MGTGVINASVRSKLINGIVKTGLLTDTAFRKFSASLFSSENKTVIRWDWMRTKYKCLRANRPISGRDLSLATF